MNRFPVKQNKKDRETFVSRSYKEFSILAKHYKCNCYQEYSHNNNHWFANGSTIAFRIVFIRNFTCTFHCTRFLTQELHWISHQFVKCIVNPTEETTQSCTSRAYQRRNPANQRNKRSAIQPVGIQSQLFVWLHVSQIHHKRYHCYT